MSETTYTILLKFYLLLLIILVHLLQCLIYKLNFAIGMYGWEKSIGIQGPVLSVIVHSTLDLECISLTLPCLAFPVQLNQYAQTMSTRIASQSLNSASFNTGIILRLVAKVTTKLHASIFQFGGSTQRREHLLPNCSNRSPGPTVIGLACITPH